MWNVCKPWSEFIRLVFEISPIEGLSSRTNEVVKSGYGIRNLKCEFSFKVEYNRNQKQIRVRSKKNLLSINWVS